ncbi:phosphopantetheine-binding protein [Streptomyces sp. NPDC057686]|uniref:phosphopantetheine-binding protein n=1 Tax=Streptomyces sp. NPDC057686 TaxID=3346212 RepID=UPI0036AF45D9
MTNEHPADVLTDLIGVLGDVLRVKPEKIDPEQTFHSMGLDSMLVVEFVAVVNARYGLRVLATDLYDFPTPASFAREVTRAASSPAAAPVSAPVPVAVPVSVPAAVSRVASAAAPAAAAPAVPAAAVPAPAAGLERQVPAPAAATRIAEVLREQLAGILCCDPWDIDTTAAFNVLGVDSIVGAEFIAVVNRTFGLHERSVLLYEHPNLMAMAAYIAVRTGASVHDFAPARTPGPAASRPALAATSSPAAPRRLPADELDVLLDAVRDDRLTVDEAVMLLARRS